MQPRTLCTFVLAALGASTSGISAQAPPGPPAGAAGACTIVGPLLGPSDFGVPAGQPVADATAALLPTAACACTCRAGPRHRQRGFADA